jgi:cupin 2 domain-containing protein
MAVATRVGGDEEHNQAFEPTGSPAAGRRLNSAMEASVTPESLFAEIPADLPEELFTTLVSGEGMRLQRIVSRGHATPADQWYDQAEDEWVLLLAGSAGLRFEGEALAHILKPGDHLLIPAHRRHRVEWTHPSQNTVWLALYARLNPAERPASNH